MESNKSFLAKTHFCIFVRKNVWGKSKFWEWPTITGAVLQRGGWLQVCVSAFWVLPGCRSVVLLLWGGFILKEQVKMTAVHVVCAWQDIGCHQCMKSLEATGCEGFAP